MVVDTPKEKVALFNIDGTLHACSARCPHAGGPLQDGFLRGTSVVCPWHGWSFDLCATGDDARDGVIRYRAAEEDGRIVVYLP
ncbi:MAG: Rieske 2Fe-2S domain-containing protein [Candidatus Hydrogenedens sp.]|nr:Rieske 2Fe-2S domain-containing protein [Candidatus Hydrogenedens sp.]